MVGPEGNIEINIINESGQTSEENPMQVNIKALGTKADSAVTDPEASGTLIALMKGTLDKLKEMKDLTA